MSHSKEGSAYVIALATTSLSTANPTNIFPFVAGSATRVRIEEISISIISTNTGAFGVKVMRGSTTTIASSLGVTPVALGGWSGHGAAGSYVVAPTTTLATTTSAVLVDARAAGDGFTYEYRPQGLELVPSQRLDVIMSAPIVPTVYATIRFREVGKNPLS